MRTTVKARRSLNPCVTIARTTSRQTGAVIIFFGGPGSRRSERTGRGSPAIPENDKSNPENTKFVTKP
jgi:hypothetical protein